MKRKKRETILFRVCRRRFGDDEESDSEWTNNEGYDLPSFDSLLNIAPLFENSLPLPYEMMMKIFTNVIEFSEHPLKDLCNLAQVCETWRQMILRAPSLWSRIDLTKVPITDGNILRLREIFEKTPIIMTNIKEFSLRGPLRCKSSDVPALIEDLMTAPNLSSLAVREIEKTSHSRFSMPTIVHRSLSRCRNLRKLSIIQSKSLFNNQKWISDHLVEHGKHLEVLNLSMSLTSISNNLLKAIGSESCPNLKYLDISTCDSLNTHSFDAIQLSKNMPNLEVLRVGNVSFKRVYSPPEEFGLKKLRELSMPIGMRDADRDDALFATLTFGSNRITTLDLRGSSITAKALLDMPSFTVTELHMDDLCPITRQDYHRIIAKWASTLIVLSLVKINCSETLKRCLKALLENTTRPILKELDLTASDVTSKELRQFLLATKSLENVNLSSCRSLPRGCKGLYSREPRDRTAQKLDELIKRLKN